MTSTTKKMSVTIISDIVCPWCWVGKRKLETALKTYLTDLQAEIVWRPYQLRPNAPLEGTLKAPDTLDNPRVGSRLKSAGATVGIDFTGKTDKSPNTTLSHVLLEYVLEVHGWKKQNEVQEALFQAYFTDGVFLSKTNLVDIASQNCGLERQQVEAALENREMLQKVGKEVEENYSKVYGQGVPFFLFNGRPAFSGAQDIATFHQVFDAVLQQQDDE